MRGVIAFSGLALVLTFAGVADAQVQAPASAATTQPSGWRRTIGVNGGVQPTGTTESQSFTVQKNVEDAPIASAFSLGSATLLDAGVTVTPARRRLGVNVSVSLTSRRFGGDVSAQIPHPFFFNTPRPVSGPAPQMLNRELVVHAAVAYEIRSSSRFALVGFTGPSIFRITQDVVTDVSYAETYPYDTATFTSAQTMRTSATALGFNLGADVTWKLSRKVGVGALVRYARGSATLTPSAGNDVAVTTGGLQLGGGLRLFY